MDLTTSVDIKPVQQVLNILRENQKFQRLLNFLNSDQRHLKISGSAGSFPAFLASAIDQASAHSQVIIATDKEEAAYILNDLENILPEKEILFQPDSFKRPNQFNVLRNSQVQQRTSNSSAIAFSKNQQIVVTYPQALLEMVVAPEQFRKEQVQIIKEEELNVDELIKKLVDFGFHRTDFVYEPGQFSIRGGIFDIFSFGNEWPYRIELFDDEVESIRCFNPSTQLSFKNIERLNLIPNVNSSFRSEQKISFFELFDNEQTLVWIYDQQILFDNIAESMDKAMEYVSKISEVDQEEWAQLLRDRAFVSTDILAQDLTKFKILSLKPSPGAQIDLEVHFDVKPQRNFNKKFDLLIQHLRENESEQIKNYITTSNKKQFQRFDAIFEDLNAQVNYQALLLGIHEGFSSNYLGISLLTDHQIFNRYHRYNLKRGFTKDQALTLKMIKELQAGDFVTHIDHGVGKYSGLEKIEINGKTQESVRLLYKNNDVLYVGIHSLHKISKFVGKDGKKPQLSKLGSDTWKKIKSKTKKKVKDIAAELIKLYAKRKAAEGFAFAPDGYLQNELEASFLYEDTPDQESTTIQVKKDMEAPHPMDRLICGDVGFGKTEIALRAVFKSVVNGKQAAVLVPTTILALQHYQTFKERLEDFGVSVDYINRFRSSKEKRIIYERLESGELEVIIGTHSLLNKKTKFKDLGILVVDEEQKFGVSAKEKLRKLKVNVDTLTLTATPIPRTLQFSLMAARDMSILRTAPPNRQAIHTEIRVFSEQVIKEGIYYEINRGGQVFFVHNRVKSLMDMVAMVRRMCPDLDIGFAHGQMEAKELEKALMDFIEKKYDVLICTNIIETGLDIPNANTIIINNAHHFGLSDLHQLRGRVGRSNRKAFCYLFCPPMSTITPEARKRLKTIEEFSDLGSGLDIAMRDLDIRGAGNLLGGEQSGFISELGYETYQKILNEAIQELKENEFKDVFTGQDNAKEYVRDVEIETDLEMLIPDQYINHIQQRLNLYTELDNLETEEEISRFRSSLEDRFGPVPFQVDHLFDGLRLRWISKKLGFERVILKNECLKCFFLGNPQSSFYESPKFQATLAFINHPSLSNKVKLKNARRHLIMQADHISTIHEALDFLKRLHQQVEEELQ